MDEVFSRFPHLGRNILDLLDNFDQSKCREASRTWKDFIDYEEIVFQRILKISFVELDPLITAAWFGQLTVYQKRCANLENKNPDWGGMTALHFAAKRVDSRQHT